MTSTQFDSSVVSAFLFYCWLCVVSHFQILREVAHLAHDNFENVQPFKGSRRMEGAIHVGCLPFLALFADKFEVRISLFILCMYLNILVFLGTSYMDTSPLLRTRMTAPP